jgi:hypothetical protein
MHYSNDFIKNNADKNFEKSETEADFCAHHYSMLVRLEIDH